MSRGVWIVELREGLDGADVVATDRVVSTSAGGAVNAAKRLHPENEALEATKVELSQALS